MKDKTTEGGHGTGRPQEAPNNMKNGRLKSRRELGLTDKSDEDKPITDYELKQLLIKIAKADLEDGADIFDHPCSIAVRRIEELSK